MKLFVYGTLKRGGHNHWLLKGATYLGHVSVHGWTMRDLGAFPAVTPGEGSVHGELYEVDSLKPTDRLEGYPGFYHRCLTTVCAGNEAWIYYLAHCDAPLIPDGIWDL